MSKPDRTMYHFDPFRLDAGRRLLMRGNEVVSIPPKAIEMLLLLVRHPGEVLDKESLMKGLWPDTIVEETNLTVIISALRKALEETRTEHRYIVTIPGHGYCFVAEVSEAGEGAGARPLNGQSEQLSVKSIAVLPFKPLGGEEKDGYLGLGMADALITKLGNFRQIIVRPTNAVVRYAGLGHDLSTVGRELDVEALIDGRIQRTDDRVRVTVQLIWVENGAPFWSEKFDERFTNIFDLQDTISEAVARALMLKMTGEEKKQVAKRYTDNLEAWQLYLKGRHFWNQRTAQGYRRAIECFEQATGIDPGYALAYAGLADSYQLLGGADGTVAPKEVFPKAKAAAVRALEIDCTLAEAHTSLARVSITYDRDWPAAERGFKQAIELNPNYTLAHMWYANYLAATGRFDDANTEISLAIKLEPLSVMFGVDAGMIFYFARQYDRAIEQIKTALELDQNFWPGHWYLGWVYEAKGMYPETLSEFERAALLSGNYADLAAEIGHVYALAGRKGEAWKVIENLMIRSKQSYVSPFALALIYMGLGDRDRAFSWLQKGSEDHCWQMSFLKIDPRFDSLRTDPRFAGLLQRINHTL